MITNHLNVMSTEITLYLNDIYMPAGCLYTTSKMNHPLLFALEVRFSSLSSNTASGQTTRPTCISSKRIVISIYLIIEHASIERERILDHYNILLDNPVTILHQEQAKTFFSQKDTEKNLWDFVMASTQMKSIHDEYRDSK